MDPSNAIPGSPSAQNDEAAQAALEKRLKEHNRLVRLSATLRHGDILDFKILNVINEVLSKPHH